MLTLSLLSLASYGNDVKSLAAVILRRNISNTATDSQDIGNADNNANLWKRLSPDGQNFVKSELLKAVSQTQDKNVVHKICNLLIEVGGTIYEQENFVWQDLLNLLFQFVNCDEDLKVDAALVIFNGLFSYLMDHLVKFKADLMGIFKKTLNRKSLDINLSALQAVSNFLQIAEGKDAREMGALLEDMAKVCIKALEQDDETVLEDALVEFNEIAEIEPKFFRKNFKDLFMAFSNIVAKDDFTNPTIRHQPVEFFVTVVERPYRREEGPGHPEGAPRPDLQADDRHRPGHRRVLDAPQGGLQSRRGGRGGGLRALREDMRRQTRVEHRRGDHAAPAEHTRAGHTR
jgi:hypothetical protein